MMPVLVYFKNGLFIAKCFALQNSRERDGIGGWIIGQNMPAACTLINVPGMDVCDFGSIRLAHPPMKTKKNKDQKTWNV
jgi:hypothetical protein